MRKPTKKKQETGLTERTLMAMASEMAACSAANRRSCELFEVLAASIGVDVSNAFQATTD